MDTTSFIDTAINAVVTHIDWSYLTVIMLMSYVLKGMLSKALKINKTAIVFMLATVLAFPFWYWAKVEHMKLFVTYCVGATLHELVIGWIISKIRTYFPKQDD